MQVREKTKEEIQLKIRNMSDFVKMEYLESCIKVRDFDIQRFCREKLADLYEDKKMFIEAAKNMQALADISVAFKDKMQAHMRQTSLLIQAGKYDDADNAFRKALATGNEGEKREMRKSIIEFYKKQALNHEKAGRGRKALEIYEKLLSMESIDAEEIKKRLLEIYSKLGMIDKYFNLKKQLE